MPVIRRYVFALLVCAVALFTVACGGSSDVPPSAEAALDRAVDWLVATQQNGDGGYSSFSQGADLAPSDPGGTLDAILALAAASRNPAAVGDDPDASPVGYLQANAAALTAYAAASNANAGKTVLGLVAAGVNPRDFAGADYVAPLGAIAADVAALPATDPYSLAITVLGLAAADAPVPADLAAALAGLQAGPDAGDLAGSWDDGFGTVGNVDATAVALLALQAAGGHAPAVQAARDFLASAQLPTGGFAYATGLPENANSTALALQALISLDEPYWTPDGPWARDGATPWSSLLSYQGASGAFQADFGGGPSDDFFATVQSLPALAGQFLPLSSWEESAP